MVADVIKHVRPQKEHEKLGHSDTFAPSVQVCPSLMYLGLVLGPNKTIFRSCNGATSDGRMLCRAIGVTFDNRQAAVRNLRVGQELMLLKHLGNGFDSYAISSSIRRIAACHSASLDAVISTTEFSSLFVRVWGCQQESRSIVSIKAGAIAGHGVSQ
jgi:hypothetical protein